jgi:hypothetical protein
VKATEIGTALFAFHQSETSTSSADIDDVSVIIAAWLLEMPQSVGRNPTVCSALCPSVDCVFGTWRDTGLHSNSRTTKQVSQP